MRTLKIQLICWNQAFCAKHWMSALQIPTFLGIQLTSRIPSRSSVSCNDGNALWLLSKSDSALLVVASRFYDYLQFCYPEASVLSEIPAGRHLPESQSSCYWLRLSSEDVSRSQCHQAACVVNCWRHSNLRKNISSSSEERWDLTDRPSSPNDKSAVR